MTVYSDDINRGFEILLEHLKTIGLYYRILNIKPIDPLLKHPIFGDSHCGGVKFDFYLADIDSKWEIVYTRRDLFDLIGSVDGKRQIFFDISYDDLINILFSLNEQKKKEEDDLLGEAISETQYRKIAKKMHYIERDEDT
tara:strand:+ start:5584 stop:6003 length:420 start_codon:yes stop_codon:yes gene_type:complete